MTSSSDPDVPWLHDFLLKISLWLEARLTTELANDAVSSSSWLPGRLNSSFTPRMFDGHSSLASGDIAEATLSDDSSQSQDRCGPDSAAQGMHGVVVISSFRNARQPVDYWRRNNSERGGTRFASAMSLFGASVGGTLLPPFYPPSEHHIWDDLESSSIFSECSPRLAKLSA